MLGKNQRLSRLQMGHVQLYQHRTTVQYSGKTENKRWFQASGTYVMALEQMAW